jgi:hypothetical protein
MNISVLYAIFGLATLHRRFGRIAYAVSDANTNPEDFVCDLSVFSEFEHSWALIGLPGGLSSALSLSLRCGHHSLQLLVCSPELLSVVCAVSPSLVPSEEKRQRLMVRIFFHVMKGICKLIKSNFMWFIQNVIQD